MSTTVIVYVLTALAALVVLLTRLRLGRGGGAGRLSTGHRLLDAHSVVGTLAVVLWLVFLIAPDGSLAGGNAAGIIALACWWITAVLGLMMLVRWLPSRGQHASEVGGDRWSRGPWLSILAHVGLLVAVGVFTWAYLTSRV